MEDVTGLGEIATTAASIANNFIDKISNAVGVVYLNSVESSLNIRYQNLKLDIQSLEEKIESLDMEQVELKSLKRLELIAAKKGYFHNLDTEIAVVCKENK